MMMLANRSTVSVKKSRGVKVFDTTKSLLDDAAASRSEIAKYAAKKRNRRKKNPSERYFNESVSSKIMNKKFDDLTAKDLLGIYLNAYKKRFGSEDVEFVKNSRFVKEYSVIRGRLKTWFDSDPYKMYRYIINTMDWWKHRLDGEFNFPSTLPSFSSLFYSDFFYKNYKLNCKEIDIVI